MEAIVDTACNDFIKDVQKEEQRKQTAKAVCEEIGHNLRPVLDHGTWWMECQRCDYGRLMGPSDE